MYGYDFRYVTENGKRSSGYRAYSNDVPQFLRNRPHRFVMHCLLKMTAAQNVPADHIQHPDMESQCFSVRSQTSHDHHYLVNFNRDGMPHCECPDWGRTFLPCKHMFAVLQHTWLTWSDAIPTAYRESVYFTLDDLYVIPQSDDRAPISVDTSSSEEQLILSVSDVNTDGEGSTDISEEGSSSQLQPNRTNSTASEVREIMHEIKSLTYIITDQDVLGDLKTSQLSHMHHLLSIADRQDGLILESGNTASNKRKSATSAHLPLPKSKKTRASRVGVGAQKTNVMCGLVDT